MTVTTITVINIEYNEIDSAGNTKLFIAQGHNTLFTYYGPPKVLLNSSFPDAIGNAILLAVFQHNKEYNNAK